MRYFLFSLLFWVICSFLITAGVLVLGYYLLMAADAPLLAPPFSLMMTISPYVALYAIPVALCLGSGLFYWQLRQRGEHVFISFLSELQTRLALVRGSILVISGCLFLLFIMHFAPIAYVSAKASLTSCIWEQISKLPTKKLLSLNSSVQLYISEHSAVGDAILAQGIVLLLKKKNTTVCVYARTGSFYADRIELNDAHAFPEGGEKRAMMYSSRQLLLPSSVYLSTNFKSAKVNHMSLHALIEQGESREIVWRLLQLLWILLLPLIIWYLVQMHTFYVGNISIAAIIAYSGGLSVVYFIVFRLLSHEKAFFINGSILLLLPFVVFGILQWQKKRFLCI